MTERIAACHCGALELKCSGEPKKISMCHCLDCQRRTGSLFSIAVFYRREHVTLKKGAPSRFDRPAVSGFPVAFYFCAQCGSNLYWEPERLPELVGVAIGAFADPNFPKPQQAVFMKDKHAWIDLPEDMQTFEVNPPPRPR